MEGVVELTAAGMVRVTNPTGVVVAVVCAGLTGAMAQRIATESARNCSEEIFMTR